jgi:hypothetical protein
MVMACLIFNGIFPSESYAFFREAEKNQQENKNNEAHPSKQL